MHIFSIQEKRSIDKFSMFVVYVTCVYAIVHYAIVHLCMPVFGILEERQVSKLFELSLVGIDDLFDQMLLTFAFKQTHHSVMNISGRYLKVLQLLCYLIQRK